LGGQSEAELEGNGLGLQVFVERLLPQIFPKSGLFEAAKGRRYVRLVVTRHFSDMLGVLLCKVRSSVVYYTSFISVYGLSNFCSMCHISIYG
jgi:hypothetical protein